VLLCTSLGFVGLEDIEQEMLEQVDFVVEEEELVFKELVRSRKNDVEDSSLTFGDGMETLSKVYLIQSYFDTLRHWCKRLDTKPDIPMAMVL